MEQEDNKGEGLNEGVDKHIVYGEVFVVGMNGWCDGQHSVIINSQLPCSHMGVRHAVCALRGAMSGRDRQWFVACG